jgi:hypothetical protein
VAVDDYPASGMIAKATRGPGCLATRCGSAPVSPRRDVIAVLHDARKEFSLRSLRVRLILILALLSAAALVCALIMLALFQQSATAQIGQATAEVGHACDAIGRAYRFYATGWRDSKPDLAAADLRRDLNAVSVTALRDKPGIEGGIWHADSGPLAYAFPTYEGAGPKTDIPQAELPRITSANQLAQKDDRPQVARFDSGAQTLLIASCPLSGPIPGLTGWTMTRVRMGRRRRRR